MQSAVIAVVDPSVGLSVCPSVRHTLALCQNNSSYDHADFNDDDDDDDCQHFVTCCVLKRHVCDVFLGLRDKCVLESDYTGPERHSRRSRPVTCLLQINLLVSHVTNSFLRELLSMAMLNLLSLLKRYWAAMMSIYFIQHPLKTISCIAFYPLPSLPKCITSSWSWPVIRTRFVWITQENI